MFGAQLVGQDFGNKHVRDHGYEMKMVLLARFDGESSVLADSSLTIDGYKVRNYIVEIDKFSNATDLDQLILETYGTTYYSSHLDRRVGLDIEDLNYIKTKLPHYSDTIDKAIDWLQIDSKSWRSVLYWSMEF